MSHAHLRPGEQKATYRLLADRRWRLTRVRALNHGDSVVPGMMPERGELDKGPTTGVLAGFAGLRFIDGYTEPGQVALLLVHIFEQIHATDETPVGKPQVNRTEDGRIEVVQEWIQFSAARATPQKVGVSVCSVWPLALADVVGNAGTDTLSVAVGLASGLRDGDVVRFPTLTGGAGLVTATDYHVRDASADTKTFKLSATAGGGVLNFTTDITAATLLQQVTLILAEEQAPDDGALRRITRRYVNRGVISTNDRQLGGGMKEVTWRSVLVREDPPGILVGDVDVQRPGGVPVYTVKSLVNAAGTDLLSGRASTFVSRPEFRYPGRCKFITREQTVGVVEFTHYSLLQAAAISVPVDARTHIYYSTSDEVNLVTAPAEIATIFGHADVTGDVWKPTDWARFEGFWLVNDTLGGGRSRVECLTGYRVESGVPDTIVFSSASGAAAVAFGDLILTGFDGTATISGGPPDPGGETWILDYGAEEAFVGADGTKYYRHTLVTAAIPAQEALP